MKPFIPPKQEDTTFQVVEGAFLRLQGIIEMIRNKKKPSAGVFLVSGPGRTKIIFYGGKFYFIMVY